MDTETIRKLCLALPGATESIKWENDLVFSVADKMFCVTSFEEPFKCSFKVADDAFEELTTRQGFVPAHYLARAKWVLVTNQSTLLLKEWEAFIKSSYNLVVSKL
ncbi:MAG: MmcQ/YjbR family DNA-binding protein [Bacteroidota bacterium]|nr:MmcQ/YjbR family DNA-binding protein [Bacteroidota bacterium]